MQRKVHVSAEDSEVELEFGGGSGYLMKLWQFWELAKVRDADLHAAIKFWVRRTLINCVPPKVENFALGVVVRHIAWTTAVVVVAEYIAVMENV